MHAAASGRLEAVRELMDQYPDIGILDKKGRSLLAIALDAGQEDVADHLVRITANVNKPFWVTSKEGLSLRMDPGTAAQRITLIPFGSRVEYLSRSLFKIEIGGVKGHWGRVEWDRAPAADALTGWLFDADLSDTHTPDMWLRPGLVYRADFKAGIFDTDAGRSAVESIEFLGDDKVRYTVQEFFFDGAATTTYDGTFSAAGDSMQLRLARGVISHKAAEEFPDVPADKSVDDMDLTLLWDKETGGLLKERDWVRITKEGYSLNRETRQYESRTAREFDSIGYFSDVK